MIQRRRSVTVGQIREPDQTMRSFGPGFDEAPYLLLGHLQAVRAAPELSARNCRAGRFLRHVERAHAPDMSSQNDVDACERINTFSSP